MNEIRAKVYYSTSTGAILTITSEMRGAVEPSNKEQDIELYEQLKGKAMDEVDYIELEYGVVGATFTNAKSYRVNLETRQLEVVYCTQAELDAKTVEVETEQALVNRMAAIHEYVQAQDETSLSTIEDSILQIELNKILNGGM